MKRDEPLGVALSGGAARGFAHVGVMQAFEEAGRRPGILTGTSAGSIVAAFWAAGWAANDLLALTKNLRWTDVVRPVLPRRGLFSLEPLGGFLERHLGKRTFADLEIPLGVVACDLVTAERVIIREGELVPALLASCAVPGIFEPVHSGGRLLVDGGVLENLPAEACAAMGAGHIVAVDLLWKRWETFDSDTLAGIVFRALTMLYSAQDPVRRLGGDRVTMLRPDLAPFSPVSLGSREAVVEAGRIAAGNFLRGVP
jgi:NTE family protein